MLFRARDARWVGATRLRWRSPAAYDWVDLRCLYASENRGKIRRGKNRRKMSLVGRASGNFGVGHPKFQPGTFVPGSRFANRASFNANRAVCPVCPVLEWPLEALCAISTCHCPAIIWSCLSCLLQNVLWHANTQTHRHTQTHTYTHHCIVIFMTSKVQWIAQQWRHTLTMHFSLRNFPICGVWASVQCYEKTTPESKQKFTAAQSEIKNRENTVLYLDVSAAAGH